MSLGFGSIRHRSGEVLAFSLFNQVQNLVWIKVERYQLVARGAWEERKSQRRSGHLS